MRYDPLSDYRHFPSKRTVIASNGRSVIVSVDRYCQHFLSSTTPLNPTRRAIFGGTFDPVHRGHETLARAACEQFHLADVIWVASVRPPHKARRQLGDRHHRQALVEQAIADTPHFSTPAPESECFHSPFARDTLRVLQRERPGDRWYWLLGADALRSLPRWVGADELVRRCEWIVAPRPPLDLDRLWQDLSQHFARRGVRWRGHRLAVTPPAISSTDVRRALRRGDLPQHWLSPAVADYLRRHPLYRAAPNRESPRDICADRDP